MKSIKGKTLAVLLPLVIATLVIMTGIAYYYSKSIILENAQEKVSLDMDLMESEINNSIVKNFNYVSGFSKNIELNYHEFTKEKLRTSIDHALGANPDIFGTGIFFEPFKQINNQKYYSMYGSHGEDKIELTEAYDDPSYDYISQDWYKKGVSAGKNAELKQYLTEPYYDDILKVTMITASIPMYDKDELVGVATGDFDLTFLQNQIKNMDVVGNGKVFLLSKDGQFLVNGFVEDSSNENIKNSKIEGLKNASETILNQKDGFLEFKHKNDAYISIYKQVENTGWIIGLVLDKSELQAEATSLLIRMVIVGIVSVLLLTAGLYLFANYISKNVKKINELSQLMATGDLTKQLTIKSSDEFGEMTKNFNYMTNNLRHMLHEVADNTTNVLATSEQLDASAEQTSIAAEKITTIVQMVVDGSNSQVQSAKENVVAMEEISKGMQFIATAATDINDTSTAIEKRAKDGQMVISRSKEQMNHINETVNNASNTLNLLNESSKEIEKIVGVITAISDQTNLLALNAAIEAARAGESGRGFAVVADEVRKLAEQSSNSAKEIQTIIANIQVNTKLAVESMKKGNEEVKNGIEVNNQVEVVFGNIIQSISEINKKIEGVTSSAQEVSSSTMQVVETVERSSEIAKNASENSETAASSTEEQLATTEEMKDASRNLRVMSEQLQELIEKFKI